VIIGIGTDLCDIRRIEAILERHGERFKEKVFTDWERSTCDARAASGACYAKRFAAKEAVAKALASETSGALPWHSVEVVNDPSGRPRAVLYGPAAARLPEDSHVHLSLTDDPPYAQAFVIIESR
jgi:holo-[acyl-carrier protein] synthase